MNVKLVKADAKDAEVIWEMQIAAFKPLLKKYQDYDFSPANEKVDKVLMRLNQPFTDYYKIVVDNENAGAIRIVKLENKRFRISPLFIIPKFQNQGIAQKVFDLIEKIYGPDNWELDTIMQETGNCYLYEKMGYKRIRKTKKLNDKTTLVFYEKNCR